MKITTALLWLLPVLASAQTTIPDTQDGTCGLSANLMCTPTWGGCCGAGDECGRSDAYCGTGCQPTYGNCNIVITPPVTAPGSTSPDGSCGGANKFNCTASSFGDCCSSSGFCGSTTAHCEAGCQLAFGKCSTGSGTVTSDGQCGANGKTCLGASYGDCCSSGGWCGLTDAHCGVGCQANFGLCPTVTSATPTPTPTSNVSTNGQCGANGSGKTCKGSIYGDCCSSGGWCGATVDHCDAATCQLAFGTCNVATTTTSAVPSPTSNISSNGQCGATGSGKTCKDSTYGDCCSTSGWCGADADHCLAVNCNPLFGTCNALIPTSTTLQTTTKTSTTATPTSTISTNGSCGGTEKKTCLGSTFGNCCSTSGYCGATSDFCAAVNCDKLFGTCNAAIPTTIKTTTTSKTNSATPKPTSNVSTNGACGGTEKKTCVGSTFGNCCSSSGFCGSAASTFCGQGCQRTFSSACLTTNIPSADGTCGSVVNLTCAGGSFDGQCCSSSGYCGTNTAFCGTGCQTKFGKCT